MLLNNAVCVDVGMCDFVRSAELGIDVDCAVNKNKNFGKNRRNYE